MACAPRQACQIEMLSALSEKPHQVTLTLSIITCVLRPDHDWRKRYYLFNMQQTNGKSNSAGVVGAASCLEKRRAIATSRAFCYEA